MKRINNADSKKEILKKEGCSAALNKKGFFSGKFSLIR